MSLDVAAAYRAHQREILIYVRQQMPYCSENDRDDVAAAVWERVVRNAGRYAEQGKGPRPWLYRVAQNMVIDYHRQKRIVAVGLLDNDREAERVAYVPARREYDNAETRTYLPTALAALTDKQRAVVTLRYLCDATTAETASVLGTTDQAVKKLRMRALVNLRKSLGEDAA